MSADRRVPGLGSPDLGALSGTHNAALPFLPTIATALIVAGVAMICPHPSHQVQAEPPAVESATLIHGFEAGARQPMPEQVASLPGTIAFAQVFPVQVVPQPSVAASAAAKAAKIAANRRTCVGGRCTETRRETSRELARTITSPTRYLPDPPTVSSIGKPFGDGPGQAQTDLPAGALPFAPTAASFVDEAKSAARDAMCIGGSVAGALYELL